MSIEDLIIKAFTKQLMCPVCTDKSVTQPMCQYGDFPNSVFCPHCDLSVTFSGLFLRGEKGHLRYVDSRVTDFLKRKKGL